MIFLQYFTGFTIDEANAYEEKYGVKLPSLYRDPYGTQENMKFEKEISGGFILLGTIYLIHPDRTVENVGHASADGNDLLPRLIELGVPKGAVSVKGHSLDLAGMYSLGFVNKQKFSVNVSNSGQYILNMFNMSGKKIQSNRILDLYKGQNIVKFNKNLSSGEYIIKMSSQNDNMLQKIIVK